MPPPGTVVALPVPVSGAARTTPGGVGQHCDAAGVDASAISGCQYQGSLTAGTIFQHTRKPLTIWFRAIWWVTAQKNGASALALQRILGLGSYLTAWTWLHKLRRAMVRPGRDRLHGQVEVDEPQALLAAIRSMRLHYSDVPRSSILTSHKLGVSP